MTALALIEPAWLGTACTIVAAMAVGTLVGAAHHLLLWRSVRSLLGRRSSLGAMAAQSMRLVVAAAALAIVGRNGALPLLAALSAFVAARFVAVRRIGWAS